jgi:hypothetical protein
MNARRGAAHDKRMSTTSEIAILTFPHTGGAERAYSDVAPAAGGAPWTREVVFVESHRHGRLVVRGTFAGRYLDVDDVGDAIGKETTEGALAGAVLGLALGPPGIAVGLVAGGTAGGVIHAEGVAPPSGELFDEVRASVPEGHSALVAYAPAADIDQMITAFEGRPEHVERRTPTSAQAQALLDAVRDAPAAAGEPPAAIDD